MKGLPRRGRVALAALLLATVAAAGSSALPAHGADDGRSLSAWIEGWLVRLVPEWVLTVASEAPPAEGTDGIAFDDPQAGEVCVPTIDPSCTGGEGLPDLDPDG